MLHRFLILLIGIYWLTIFIDTICMMVTFGYLLIPCGPILLAIILIEILTWIIFGECLSVKFFKYIERDE